MYYANLFWRNEELDKIYMGIISSGSQLLGLFGICAVVSYFCSQVAFYWLLDRVIGDFCMCLKRRSLFVFD